MCFYFSACVFLCMAIRKRETLLTLRNERFGRPLKWSFFPPHPLHPSGNTELLYLQTTASLYTSLGERVVRAVACSLGKAHSQAQEASVPFYRHLERNETTNDQVILASKHLGTVILCSGWTVEPTKLHLQYFLPIMHFSAVVKKEKRASKHSQVVKSDHLQGGWWKTIFTLPWEAFFQSCQTAITKDH